MIQSARSLLEMHDIHMNYGELQALKGVDFNLFQGEIHALTGEHRAGKSTLVKILSGAERARSGTIYLNGKQVSYFTPRSAMRQRIGTVYQNTAVIPDLEPLDFIFAHQLPTRGGMITYRKMEATLQELMDRYGIFINYHTKIRNLPADQQFLIEFLRALIIEPQILILDEFSNKLTPTEMQNVYRVIDTLKAQGCGIIYISHDIQEVIKFADRVTILNKGRRLETDMVSNLDSVRLYELTYSFSIDQQQLVQADKLMLFNDHVRRLIHEIPLGVFILDNELNIQTMNTRAKSLLGLDLSTKSINEGLPAFLATTFPKHHDEILNEMYCHASHNWIGLEAIQNRKLDVQVSSIRDDNSEPIGTLLIVQDNALDDSIKEYLQKTEKFASIAEMAVGVAHEINNPLFAIKNYLELVAMKNENPYIAEKLQTIHLELDRIVRTISSLLNFSKIKTEYFQQVDLSSLLEDVLLLLNHRLNAKHIVVVRRIVPGVMISRGIEDKLKQLFINLIMNSIDAILDYGKIQIEVVKSFGKAKVRIKDNGNGIPEEIRDKIFEPFYSTKVNKFNTGLGLAISKHIVEAHEGTIAIEDDRAYRTCLTVTLPL